MAFLDFFASLGRVEEMRRSIGVERAENPVFCDAIPEEKHAIMGIFFIDETHFVNAVGGIVHQREQVIEDSGLRGDPFMGAAVEMKHHAGQGLSGPFLAVFVPLTCFINFAGGL